MKVEMQMGRKGQKSLEMIIGLVILLVVAAVVISMFLNIFQEPDVGQDSVELEKIRQQCSQACDSWKSQGLTGAVEYCTMKFVYDENGDGNTRQVVRNGYNSYCEDGVHCFNVHTCSPSFETLDAEKCRELLCQAFQQNQGEDPSGASTRIQDYFDPANEQTGVGSCDLANLQDPTGSQLYTWYNAPSGERDFYDNVDCQTVS